MADTRLTKKLQITILGAADRKLWGEYVEAVRERHNALFGQFEIEPPAPDAAGDPAWRDLALALARKYIPAFKPNAGRPATVKEETLTWLLASYYFQYRNDSTLAIADRMVADHFGVDRKTVEGRLKEMRRKAEYQDGGAFVGFLQRLETDYGRAAVATTLSGVLTPDLEFNQRCAAEIEKLRKFPY